MSCRRKSTAASSAPSPPAVATADVGERELSAAAKSRVQNKAARPAAGAPPAAFPWVPFTCIVLVMLAVLYATVKYS